MHKFKYHLLLLPNTHFKLLIFYLFENQKNYLIFHFKHQDIHPLV